MAFLDFLSHGNQKCLQRLNDARVKANKQHYFCAFLSCNVPSYFLSCVYYLLYLLSLDILNGQSIFSPTILFVLFHWAYAKWIKDIFRHYRTGKNGE